MIHARKLLQKRYLTTARPPKRNSSNETLLSRFRSVTLNCRVILARTSGLFDRAATARNSSALTLPSLFLS